LERYFSEFRCRSISGDEACTSYIVLARLREAPTRTIMMAIVTPRDADIPEVTRFVGYRRAFWHSALRANAKYVSSCEDRDNGPA
jgi:hypothetical protein